MNDNDYFHMMLSVFLVLMLLVTATAVDFELHHFPQGVVGSFTT